MSILFLSSHILILPVPCFPKRQNVLGHPRPELTIRYARTAKYLHSLELQIKAKLQLRVNRQEIQFSEIDK